ncbi:MAG TPA: hypothetical protein VIL68_05935 [Propionibacteriaceae bacterium]
MSEPVPIPSGIIYCYTKCWPCMFGSHDSSWHTWADEDDIAYAAERLQPDPSKTRCGCDCCGTPGVPDVAAQAEVLAELAAEADGDVR